MADEVKGVRRSDLNKVKVEFPTIQAITVAERSKSSGKFKGTMSASVPTETVISAIRVRIEGIVGNKKRRRCSYHLIVDVSDLSNELPDVWVESPDDGDIRHVNIWHSNHSFCPLVDKHLPSFCWGTMPSAWREAEPSQRNLGTFLDLARQLLNSENHSSKAR